MSDATATATASRRDGRPEKWILGEVDPGILTHYGIDESAKLVIRNIKDNPAYKRKRKRHWDKKK